MPKKKRIIAVLIIPVLLFSVFLIMIHDPAEILTSNSGWISSSRATIWLLYFNPDDILTEQSESFSIDQFIRIEVGQAISRAHEALGEPIIIKDTTSCANCKVYFYQGEYPQWVFGGTECWYVVDAKGIIIERVRVREP